MLVKDHLSFSNFSMFHTLYTGRKLEEKKLKCKQAIDAAEKIKKENILIKNEVSNLVLLFSCINDFGELQLRCHIVNCFRCHFWCTNVILTYYLIR